MTSEDRLERIEANAAHQEAALDDLSDTVRAQWDEIERLRREVARLTRTLEALMQAPDDAPPADQKPPHY